MPRVLHAVNRERAGHQLNLVAEDLASDRSRKKELIQEHTFSKRQIEWRGPAMLEDHGLVQVGCIRRACKHDAEIRDLESWLVHNDRVIRANGCECHFPRALDAAAMFDPGEHRRIPDQREEEHQKQTSPDGVWFFGRGMVCLVQDDGVRRAFAERMVEPTGIEPATFSLRTRRSTN